MTSSEQERPRERVGARRRGRPKTKEETIVVHVRIPVSVYDEHARRSLRDGETLHARIARAVKVTASRLPPAPI